jgi:hypothetical protein
MKITFLRLYFLVRITTIGRLIERGCVPGGGGGSFTLIAPRL